MFDSRADLDPPTPLAEAIEQIQCWPESPNLVLLGEGEVFFTSWSAVARRARVKEALCTMPESQHCAFTMASRGTSRQTRDFSRYPQLRTEKSAA